MPKDSAAKVVVDLWDKIGEKKCKNESKCVRLLGLQLTYQGMALDAISRFHSNCPEIANEKEVVFLDGSSVKICMEGDSVKEIREVRKATVEVAEKEFIESLNFFSGKVNTPVSIC